MLSAEEKLNTITNMIQDIGEVKDLDLLLERILTNARKFFNADAGSIYLRTADQLKFSYTQNDTLHRRLNPGKKLIYHTFSVPINKNSIAGYVGKKGEVVNIPDVYKINNNPPYTFDSHFDEISNYKTRSMLTVPMTNRRGDLLGVMQIINAQDDHGNVIPFAKSDEDHITTFVTSAAHEVERAQMTRNIILRMIKMAELRDPMETGAHVNRVAAYSAELFEEWAKNKGYSPKDEHVVKQKDVLRLAVMLHDVGKIAITDLILKKPARLNLDEYEEMKSHTYKGAKLFEDIESEFDEIAAEVALNHHEKWDGTGYPGHIDPYTEKPLPGHEGDNGQPRPKVGEEIPLFGRIVAVADVYDALCSRRSYKEPWDEERILEEMHKSSGKHFDPEITGAFFSCFDVLKSIKKRFPDEDKELGEA
jgi:HD-GYP domain-containing protein (c-di-GMP phosphodiesterase class II)